MYMQSRTVLSRSELLIAVVRFIIHEILATEHSLCSAAEILIVLNISHFSIKYFIILKKRNNNSYKCYYFMNLNSTYN